MTMILVSIVVFACFAFSIGPLLLYGIFHEGSAAIFIFGVVLAVLGLLWKRFPDRRFRGWPPEPVGWWKWLRSSIAGLLAVCIAVGLVLSAAMAKYAWLTPPPKEGDSTVVVLGCKIHGDTPSLMLKHRLDAAYDYLVKNPHCSVVVTGGMDEAEGNTEANVAQQYLVDRGIGVNRIVREEMSTNTRENFENTALFIEELKLSQNVVVVTNSYHQWRGQEYARRAGLNPVGGVPAKTSWGLFPGYWVREMMGICKLFLLEDA